MGLCPEMGSRMGGVSLSPLPPVSEEALTPPPSQPQKKCERKKPRKWTVCRRFRHFRRTTTKTYFKIDRSMKTCGLFSLYRSMA